MLSSLPLAAAPQPPSPLRESIPTLVQPRSDVVEADDLVSRVRQEIDRRLSTDADVLTVSTVGRTLGYSRSLQRKLAERGTSLSALVDGARHDRAIRLLSGDEIGLADVAQQLGFESVTAFFRAFRRWTGTTPRVFQTDQRRARTTITESMIPPSPLDEADQVIEQKQAV